MVFCRFNHVKSKNHSQEKQKLMKKNTGILLLIALLPLHTVCQIYNSGNGLSETGTGTGKAVKLGGTLIENTSIDLGSTFQFSLSKSTQEFFSVLNNGNVGIGTPSPSHRLDVNGSARFSSSITHNGITGTAPPDGITGYSSLNDISGAGCIVGLSGSNYATGVGFQNKAMFGGGVASGGSGTIQFRTGGYADGNERMRINANGNVGIGTLNPVSKLDVNTSSNVGDGIAVTGSDPRYKITSTDASSTPGYVMTNTSGEVGSIFVGGPTSNYPNLAGFYTTASNGFSILNATGTQMFRIMQNDNVGIGTTNITDAGYKLFVETGIRTRKVKVDQSTWADYVFDGSYKLRSLRELKQFIDRNHHLPEVPTTEQVTKDGLDLGDNQAILLKKIEELTLYVLELNETVIKQQNQIEDLKKRAAKRKN